MTKVNFKDSIRSSIAGGGAVGCKEAAEFLFEVGGKKLLTEESKCLIKGLAETTFGEQVVKMATKSSIDNIKIAATTTLNEAGKEGAKTVVKETTKKIACESAKGAFKAVAGQAGRAAGLGLILDGAIGAVEAVNKYNNGEMDSKEAFKHVAKEASSGAVSSAAGVLAGAALVAITGPVSLPLMFCVGAGVSIGTKLGITKMFS